MFESILQFGGRLHPMILHAPIGLLIGLAALEIIGIVRSRPLTREVRLGLIWLTVAAAAVSIATGLLLDRGGGYPVRTAWLHQWLAISAGASAAIAAIAAQARRAIAYAFFLTVSAGLLVPAGHLGATMTHGEDFLLEPFRARPAPAVAAEVSSDDRPVTSPDSVYARLIAPVFENHCTNCHGPTKHKGGLSLHTPQAIVAGGDSGPAIAPGDAAASEIIRRLDLPIDDEEHMPPRSKDQLSAEQRRLLERWIRAGASFESTEELGEGPASSHALPPAATALPAAADARAIAAIRDRLVHVEAVAQGSPLLVVDAAAVSSSIGDAEVESLLSPISAQVADLSLARTAITDRAMTLISSMPNLRRLNISGTAVGDAGAGLLASHPKLEELVIAQTPVTDAGLRAVAGAPSLRAVYVWGTKATPEGIGSVRHARGELLVDTGEFSPAEAIDAETEVLLKTAEAKPPGPDALTPSNSVCPVSGKPVDGAFALVHKGRVIGFCCRVCLGQFLDDPAKYEGKLN